MRKTKIIVTFGPAINNETLLKKAIIAGANVIRLNMSHSTPTLLQETIDSIKKIRKELSIPVSMMLDTKGPEIRVGKFENPCNLVKGQIYSFCEENILGNNQICSISKPEIFNQIKLGYQFTACNGLIKFKVVDIKPKLAVCKVLTDGVISSNKSLSFPGIKLLGDYLNNSDKEDILWAIKNKIEYVSASFVNSKEDVLSLKKFIDDNNGNIKIISKIESKFGVKNIDEIIAVSDGIMVARGDLGIEMPMELVPEEQKSMISKAKKAGKLVITATEMLESMILNPRPTRAETSDVANAIYDGTGAIMLSGETSIGKYPIETIETMAKIASATEKNIKYKENYLKANFACTSLPDVMSNAAIYTSFMLKDIKAICVYTDSGHTARTLSKYYPSCPIYAFTPNDYTFNQLSLIWGVKPIICKSIKSADKLFSLINSKLKSLKLATSEDLILIGTGSRNPKNTDMIKIFKIK